MPRAGYVAAIALVLGALSGLVFALVGVIVVGRLVAREHTSYEDLFPFVFVVAPFSLVAGAMAGRRLVRGKR